MQSCSCGCTVGWKTSTVITAIFRIRLQNLQKNSLQGGLRVASVIAEIMDSTACGQRGNKSRNKWLNANEFNLLYAQLFVFVGRRDKTQFTQADSTQRLSRVFVYNVIHVGYFKDDVPGGYQGDNTDTNKQNPQHRSKNVNLIRFTWLIAGLCPRLRDCVRSLDKQTDSITESSWRLHNTFKNNMHTHTRTHKHFLYTPLTGVSVRYLHVIPHAPLD